MFASPPFPLQSVKCIGLLSQPSTTGKTLPFSNAICSAFLNVIHRLYCPWTCRFLAGEFDINKSILYVIAFSLRRPSRLWDDLPIGQYLGQLDRSKLFVIVKADSWEWLVWQVNLPACMRGRSKEWPVLILRRYIWYTIYAWHYVCEKTHILYINVLLILCVAYLHNRFSSVSERIYVSAFNVVR